MNYVLVTDQAGEPAGFISERASEFIDGLVKEKADMNDASKYGTPFQESEALLAVQSDDIEEAERILREMLPGELASLARAAGELRDMANSMIRIKRRSAS